MVRIHHVNLHVSEDQFGAERTFLIDGLGFRHVEPPPELVTRAHWFDDDDGVQIHLSVVEDRQPLDPGHVAIVLGDQFKAVLDRITSQGCKTSGPGSIVNCWDPAGNRWELRRG